MEVQEAEEDHTTPLLQQEVVLHQVRVMQEAVTAHTKEAPIHQEEVEVLVREEEMLPLTVLQGVEEMALQTVFLVHQ